MKFLFAFLFSSQVFAGSFELVTRIENGLPELSGITFSSVHKNVFWGHNDSGDGAFIYAIDLSGKIRAKFKIDGAISGDWEDIASGPCLDSPKSCLYIGDIGDKKGVLSQLRILMVEEPSLLQDGTLALKKEIIFNGDGKNFEALAFRPNEKDFILISKKGKRQSPTGKDPDLYRLTSTGVMTKSGKLNLGGEHVPGTDTLVTGADYNPRTHELLVGTYSKFYVYNSQMTLVRSGDIPAIPKAEAFAWGPGGIYVTGEETNPELFVLAP
ncbi:MAG: hypothetical protein V4598_08185 [Bdellovibrionota bacterium]